MANVRIVVNSAATRTMLMEAAGRATYITGLKVEGIAKTKCPVDTGRLRSSISTASVVIRGMPAARVGTNVNYAPYVLGGTGVYGPRHARIIPKRGKFLVFNVNGKTVFAKSTSGMKGNPFLIDALREVTGISKRG